MGPAQGLADTWHLGAPPNLQPPPCTAQPRGDAEWQGELRSLAKMNSTQAETADFLWNSAQFLPTPHPYFRCLSPTVLLLSSSGVSSSHPHSPPTVLPFLSHPPPLPRFLPPSQACLHLSPFSSVTCSFSRKPGSAGLLALEPPNGNTCAGSFVASPLQGWSLGGRPGSCVPLVSLLYQGICPSYPLSLGNLKWEGKSIV